MNYNEKLQKAIRLIESISEYSGRIVAWLVLVMVLVIGYDVTTRYVFQIGSVALQELEWHLFSLVFLLGAAYTLKHDGHVRVDIIYRSGKINDKHRAWIDLLGTIFFLIPFCLLIIISAWPFVNNAYNFAEGSPDPGGLPYRYLLKAVIPFGFGLVLLQGLAIILRCITVILAPPPSTSQTTTDGPA